MSWSNYIDLLMEKGKLEKAAICGFNSPYVWANTPDFNISDDEVKAIVKIDQEQITCTAINLCGTKFFILRNEWHDDQDPVLQLQNPNSCATVSKLKTGFVVGLGKKENGSAVRDQMFKTVEFLRKSGY